MNGASGHRADLSLPDQAAIERAAAFISQADALVIATGFEPGGDDAHCELVGAMCAHCGGMSRPNILMFDDWHWLNAHREAQAVRRQRWFDRVRRPVGVKIGIGVNIATGPPSRTEACSVLSPTCMFVKDEVGQLATRA